MYVACKRTGALEPRLTRNQVMKLGHTRMYKTKLRREARVEAERRFYEERGLDVPPEANTATTADSDDEPQSCGAAVAANFSCDRKNVSRYWSAGVVAFALGNALNFLSFSYAAQSLLASLGAVQFVTNVVFANLVLKEPITSRVAIGTAVLVCGVALVVAFSCHGNPATTYSLADLVALFYRRAYLAYAAVLAGLACVSLTVEHKVRNRVSRQTGPPSQSDEVLYGFAYAATSAIVGAQSVTFFKILSGLFTIIASVSDSDDITARNVYASPFLYVIAFLAIGTCFFWVHRLNAALRMFDAIFIVPVFQVAWTTLSVVGGGIFFREFEDCFQGLHAVLFTLGLLVIFCGVFILSPSSSSDAESVAERRATLVDPTHTPFASPQTHDSPLASATSPFRRRASGPFAFRRNGSMNYGLSIPFLDAVDVSLIADADNDEIEQLQRSFLASRADAQQEL